MKKHALKLILLLMIMSVTAIVKAQKDEGSDNQKLPYTLQRAEDDHVYFDKVYPIEGVNKEELYKRIKQWVTTTLKTADNNIAFDDKEFNYINNTGTISLQKYPGSYVSMKLSIHFKDNKVRLECPSFSYIYSGRAGEYNAEFGQMKTFAYGKKFLYRNFDDEFTALLQSFEKALNTSSQKGSDW